MKGIKITLNKREVVQEYYLICKNCNGYYKLEEDDYLDDFGVCNVCNGDLIIVNDINEYYQYPDYKYVNKKNRKSFINKIMLIILSLCILISIILFSGIFSNLLGLPSPMSHDHSLLGSDSSGYVTKDTYSHYFSGPKIAVITGMHPREISAKTVLPSVIKSYAANHNVEIVNYQINVTDNPQDYTIGRKNGERLAARYIVPDIEKSNYALVIIAHDHKQSYGNGYYIATPTMDLKSVPLAENIHMLMPNFNYYQRSADERPQSTSITNVDKPIVITGTPVFVYEIPEWAGYSDVYSNSNRLIDVCYHNL